MLVCSSPQLIAAYHVLLRLLEPRHPPYALICFKNIQILFGVLPPDKSLSVLQLCFSQYVKELIPARAGTCQCAGLEPVDPPSPLAEFGSHHYLLTAKELRQHTPSRITSDPSGCGGYRSRTDDPLLA